MSITLTQNAELLMEYVNKTGKNIFLTGKAGTGKTTLLKHLLATTYKKNVVAAPTGVAAINAGGVTLHSLFHLPFGVFAPDDYPNQMAVTEKVNTPQTVTRQLKMNSAKRRLIREMELLVIDEVSMLRADMLDCINLVLQKVRRNTQPFGGVQMLFIGDMSQLSPVVKRSEKALIDSYYESPFFFSSNVMSQTDLVYIELDKVYRQSDHKFLELLNRVRDNELTPEDRRALNEKVAPADKLQKEKIIHLTTHNRIADEVNERELNKLKGKRRSFEAIVTGDFPESMYPIPPVLELKTGARVMFVRNDPEKRFFNGKIGTVEDIEDNCITVSCEDGEVVELEPNTWENKRFRSSKRSGEIEEKTIGSFQQFPLRLAWAITIHKSQGLTFEKAILDLNQSFAPGQLYVALSRLVSLDGLFLASKMPTDIVPAHEKLGEFESTKQEAGFLKDQLGKEHFHHLANLAGSSLDIVPMGKQWRNHLNTFDKQANRSKKQIYFEWTNERFKEVQELYHKTVKPLRQIAQLKEAYGQNLNQLASVLSDAKPGVMSALNDLINKLKAQRKTVKEEEGLKQYSKELEELLDFAERKKQSLYRAMVIIEKAAEGKTPKPSDLSIDSKPGSKKKAGKKDKTPSYKISLRMFQNGTDIGEIARDRNLTKGTIFNHLAKSVEDGTIPPTDLIEESRYDELCHGLDNIKFDNLTEAREKLDRKYDYDEIRLALKARKEL